MSSAVLSQPWTWLRLHFTTLLGGQNSKVVLYVTIQASIVAIHSWFFIGILRTTIVLDVVCVRILEIMNEHIVASPELMKKVYYYF
jgi:hypothetical protein